MKCRGWPLPAETTPLRTCRISVTQMIVGTEWLIEATGCAAERLRNIDLLRSLFTQITGDLNLQVIGDITWHQFPEPGGITGFAVLSESHLACHTYPEYGVATFNLYCCRARPEWPWHDSLKHLFGATETKIRAIERSVTAESMFDESLLAVAARQS